MRLNDTMTDMCCDKARRKEAAECCCVVKWRSEALSGAAGDIFEEPILTAETVREKNFSVCVDKVRCYRHSSEKDRNGKK